MRVLFTSLRNTSHFLPLVPYIEACRRRGHEVAVAVPADLREQVAKTGATLFPLSHPGDAGLEPFWARMRDAPEPDRMGIVIGEVFAGICADTALPDLLAAMERFSPSIVVRESSEFSAVTAAEKLGVPHVRAAITSRATEGPIFDIAVPRVDARGRTVGLSPDPDGRRIRQEPTFTFFPESLEPPEVRALPVRRFRASRKEPAPLPDWWPGRKEPLVYVTLGTVAGGMSLVRSVYADVLAAVAELPVRALLTIGKELPLDALGTVPPNVHVERFVPQDDVLPRAAAVLCHGGSGTVLGTLAAGVPMVVTPLFADQPVNAGSVAAAGAGLAVTDRSAFRAEIPRALERVLGDGSFREAARRIAQEIARLEPVEAAPLELERLAGAS